ncbi:MAG TPA: antibiotic biosynthesis monooxygenase [Solirubrobacteraceae bacterium]|nr:antibiotic biosynthesis monooxygenase [Solirubrobacteraceae bacterium]
MSVYTIWESEFPAERRQEGAEVTRAIWHDMRAFDGYLAHEIVEDLDRPGHVIVVGRWASREAADAALSYRSSPNHQRVDALVAGPRRRTVGRAIDSGAGITT